MTNTEEIIKTIISKDTKEVTDLLEALDENSKLLAKTYLSALVDRQKLEDIKLAKVAVQNMGK